MKSIAELNAILETENPESGIRHCVICGTPYKPYHSRQKTCGSAECKKANHSAYYKEWYEGNETAKEKHRYANWKYMQKVREKKKAERNADVLEEHWEKQKEFDKKISEYGDNYGEMQKQKILQGVERIKTEL